MHVGFEPVPRDPTQNGRKYNVSTYIGLISDVHATTAPLQEALTRFHEKGVDHILCPGDVVGYGEEAAETIELLIEAQCQTILGNHEVWYLDDADEDNANPITDFLHRLPPFLEFKIENKTMYMVHASPPDSYMDGIKLLDENGAILSEEKQYWAKQLARFDYDILIVGHTHQVFAERLANTQVINPGSTKFNHTCAILELPSMKIEIIPLSGKSPVKTWNWGQYFSQDNRE